MPWVLLTQGMIGCLLLLGKKIRIVLLDRASELNRSGYTPQEFLQLCHQGVVESGGSPVNVMAHQAGFVDRIPGFERISEERTFYNLGVCWHFHRRHIADFSP